MFDGYLVGFCNHTAQLIYGKKGQEIKKKKKKSSAEHLMKFVLPLASIEGPCKLQFKN